MRDLNLGPGTDGPERMRVAVLTGSTGCPGAVKRTSSPKDFMPFEGNFALLG
jgi:hypothetical protein